IPEIASIIISGNNSSGEFIIQKEFKTNEWGEKLGLLFDGIDLFELSLKLKLPPDPCCHELLDSYSLEVYKDVNQTKKIGEYKFVYSYENSTLFLRQKKDIFSSENPNYLRLANNKINNYYYPNKSIDIWKIANWVVFCPECVD